ncbi:MAG: right-handed parallel beta-helix repeat-containing protein, partial [Bacteroidota bacterium]
PENVQGAAVSEAGYTARAAELIFRSVVNGATVESEPVVINVLNPPVINDVTPSVLFEQTVTLHGLNFGLTASDVLVELEWTTRDGPTERRLQPTRVNFGQVFFQNPVGASEETGPVTVTVVVETGAGRSAAQAYTVTPGVGLETPPDRPDIPSCSSGYTLRVSTSRAGLVPDGQLSLDEAIAIHFGQISPNISPWANNDPEVPSERDFVSGSPTAASCSTIRSDRDHSGAAALSEGNFNGVEYGQRRLERLRLEGLSIRVSGRSTLEIGDQVDARGTSVQGVGEVAFLGTDIDWQQGTIGAGLTISGPVAFMDQSTINGDLTLASSFATVNETNINGNLVMSGIDNTVAGGVLTGGSITITGTQNRVFQSSSADNFRIIDPTGDVVTIMGNASEGFDGAGKRNRMALKGGNRVSAVVEGPTARGVVMEEAYRSSVGLISSAAAQDPTLGADPIPGFTHAAIITDSYEVSVGMAADAPTEAGCTLENVVRSEVNCSIAEFSGVGLDVSGTSTENDLGGIFTNTDIGIRLAGAEVSQNRLTSTAEGNRIGIHMTDGTHHNTVQFIRTSGITDRGVVIEGRQALNNRVEGGDFWETRMAGVHIRDGATGTVVQGDRLAFVDNERYGIWVADSGTQGTAISGLGGIGLRDLIFEDNTVAGIYIEGDGNSGPEDTTIGQGITIEGTEGIGIWISGVPGGVTFSSEDVRLLGSRIGLQIDGGTRDVDARFFLSEVEETAVLISDAQTRDITVDVNAQPIRFALTPDRLVHITEGANNITVRGTLTKTGEGIRADKGAHTLFLEPYRLGDATTGIHLEDVRDVEVLFGEVYDANTGIWIEDSERIRVRGARVPGGQGAFGPAGADFSNVYGLLSGRRTDSGGNPDDTGIFVRGTSRNVTLTGLMLDEWTTGIHLNGVSGVRIGEAQQVHPTYTGELVQEEGTTRLYPFYMLSNDGVGIDITGGSQDVQVVSAYFAGTDAPRTTFRGSTSVSGTSNIRVANATNITLGRNAELERIASRDDRTQNAVEISGAATRNIELQNLHLAHVATGVYI